MKFKYILNIVDSKNKRIEASRFSNCGCFSSPQIRPSVKETIVDNDNNQYVVKSVEWKPYDETNVMIVYVLQKKVTKK